MAKQDRHRINQDIDTDTIRLIHADELKEKYSQLENGIMSTSEALRIAEELELDLVEISGRSVPPVCRIVSYAKFKEEQQKRRETVKAKQNKPELKEIRFSPNADEHDFLFKLRHAEKFLQEGYKLKVFVHFRGGEIQKGVGKDILDRFAANLMSCGKPEAPSQMEGRRMVMLIVPAE